MKTSFKCIKDRGCKITARIAIIGLLSLLTLVAILIPMVSCHIKASSEEKVEPKTAPPIRVYQVNKKVSDFPEEEDFSTPESAYAAINRVMASGGSRADWDRVSGREVPKGKAPAYYEKSKVAHPEIAEMWLNARIVEVRIFKNVSASVITEITDIPEEYRRKLGEDVGEVFYDRRSVERKNEQWFNKGHGHNSSLEAARKKFAKICGKYVERPTRPKIEDPEAYLRPFVRFLKEKGEDPKPFMLKALAHHKVVILGEVHHRPRYWAFNSSLVKDPNFGQTVGTIYMELPSNDQPLIDQFLAAEELDTEPVMDTLRDVFEQGWPDRPMLDFFVTVWKVNQTLPPDRRLRVVLVDMQRPWELIQKREDWRPYHVDRDKFMAENITRDLRVHPEEKRNALFLVGHGHAMLDLKYGDGKTPVPCAGSYLRQEFGADSVYSLFPHKPSMTNMGIVHGRLCLGLFDSAFAAIGNRPVAFPLNTGPFGEQPYDAAPDDWFALGKYSDAYSAYLYLGPLENEIFSPLIPGFYTEEHMKEIDRRFRLMNGKPWHEIYRRERTDAENFITWMSGSWGQPRKWIRSLGPINAWHLGDNWESVVAQEQHEYALKHPEVIVSAANGLFEAIRRVDYDNPPNWRDFPDPQHDYYVLRWADAWAQWICENFKQNPIQTVELGEVFTKEKSVRQEGKLILTGNLPTIPYKLTLRDGTVLEGVLPFFYDGKRQSWIGMHGLDWHLQENPIKSKKPD